MIFAKVDEKDITRAILRGFSGTLDRAADSDVIVVGSGPSGLVASRELARRGLGVTLIERNNYLGGGFWIGGYFMNKATLRAPAHETLEEIGVPCERFKEGLYVAEAPHAAAQLIVQACEAGVRILQLTMTEDVVLKDGRVAGAVVNWSAVQTLPRQITCLDPVALEAKVVIDATGHEAMVCRSLNKRGLLELKGEAPMWVNASEDLVVERTGEVFPGLVAAGMAVAAVFGLPRMGPTFGGMLLSGKKAAETALGMVRAPAAALAGTR